jgi:hypothetical protein
MSLRRSPERAGAERDWAGFVAANRARLQAAGLPPLATQTVAHWDDLLTHGHFAQHEDPSGFSIGSLSARQYSVLVDLVESYFLAGYEYFAPTALKVEDLDRLTSRFGG